MELISQIEFTRLMARLGPFEPKPRIAVAVSGGADSMALALLAASWARKAGGAVVALTVDHGLRPEAAAEARQVARWMRARKIAHRTLRWTGAKPDSNIAAAARVARYALLADWCRRNAVLHLLLAHHLDDQAETVLIRLARGSGLEGLSGMAAIAELPDVRLLRPLLHVPRERLRVTLQKLRQPWLEDPTNRDPAYTRVRVRVALAESEVSPRALAETAARLARARVALEGERARLLARAAWIHPSGFARLDLALFKAAPEEVGLRALAALLRCISGGAYPPRFERLQRLYREIVSGRMPKSRTLGGCLVTRDRYGLVVVREPAATPSTPLVAGKAMRWDDRFEIATPGAAKRRLTVAGIGAEGWAQIVRKAPELRKSALPIEARMGLPALRTGNHVVVAPHLGYGRGSAVRVRFAPPSALAGALFFIV